MAAWDFAGDEVIFFIASGAVGLIGAWHWYSRAVLRSPLRRCAGIRFALMLLPVAALLGLALVLTHWADPKYVAGHVDYELLFLSGGVAWICLAIIFAHITGAYPL